jgi:phospholipid/cholesterol/gamma-HCH transport system substrate-binding protein
LLGVQEKIRVALRNVDKVIADNEVAVKDTLRNFESFTASLSGNGEKITGIIDSADSGVAAVDGALTKTQNFLGSLASDKYGGELLPTVISLRELIESFDKKSGTLIAETRKMLGDVSQSVNKAGEKFGRPRR